MHGKSAGAPTEQRSAWLAGCTQQSVRPLAYCFTASCERADTHSPAAAHSDTCRQALSLPLLVTHTHIRTHTVSQSVSHQPSFNSLPATGQQLRQAPCSSPAGKSRPDSQGAHIHTHARTHFHTHSDVSIHINANTHQSIILSGQLILFSTGGLGFNARRRVDKRAMRLEGSSSEDV